VYRTYGTTELSNSLLMVLVGLLLGGPSTLITTACAVDIAEGTVRGFQHGFCCVRVSSIELRLLYGARFSAWILLC
jgi:hypothetical protein